MNLYADFSCHTGPVPIKLAISCDSSTNFFKTSARFESLKLFLSEKSETVSVNILSFRSFILSSCCDKVRLNPWKSPFVVVTVVVDVAVVEYVASANTESSGKSTIMTCLFDCNDDIFDSLFSIFFLSPLKSGFVIEVLHHHMLLLLIHLYHSSHLFLVYLILIMMYLIQCFQSSF
jgi:hypothetical protein